MVFVVFDMIESKWNSGMQLIVTKSTLLSTFEIVHVDRAPEVGELESDDAVALARILINKLYQSSVSVPRVSNFTFVGHLGNLYVFEYLCIMARILG